MENNERVELDIYRVANRVVVAPTDRIDDEPRAKKRKPGEDQKWGDGDPTDAQKTKYPRRHQYWSSRKDLRLEAVSEAMPRNEFDRIVKCLHLANNLRLDGSDKFAKVSTSDF